MKSYIWQTLPKSKQVLSLCLFFLLNGLGAIAVLLLPFYSQQCFIPSVIAISVSSIILLILTLFRTNRLININIVAFFYGLLWAVQLLIKNNILIEHQHSVLMMSLMSVLLIATFSFINNTLAFILYCLPVYLVIFWLGDSECYPWLVFTITLPALGIAIQRQIQKRHTKFIHRMTEKFKKEREMLCNISMLDPLTGIYNRRGFQHQFDSIMMQKRDSHYILLLDIDYFKSYNDHYGHSMGDQALIRVSAAIRDAVGTNDIVARYGGEEFLVMLTDINHQQALQTAERIRQHVYELNITHQFNNELIDNITISIGVAPLQGKNIDQALLQADKALYQAKGYGRNKTLTTELFNLH